METSKPHYLYSITVGEKSYIGVSKNVRDRWGHHPITASKIGDAIRHYGRDAASFRVLACGSHEYIYELEEQAIEAFNTRWPNGYNLAAGGSGGRDPLPSTRVKLAAAASKTHKGRKQSLEHIANRVAARRRNGKKLTPEQRARMSAARLGEKHTPEHTAKIVATRKARGYKHSAETKAKIGTANKGRVLGSHSIETNEKISATHKAKGTGIGRDMSQLIKLSADLRRGVPLSEEHCAKISDANTGRKATPGALINMSKAQKGKFISGETREKISASLKLFHRKSGDSAHV
jgi:hypothetical protein